MMGVLNHLSTLLLLSLLPPALSHVVEKFSDVPECKDFFLEGTTPNLPGILVGGTVQDQNRYKPICQKFKYTKKNVVYETYMFATLYDTTNRIPVFSAYTFTGNVVGSKRPKNPTWMIEPQLEDIKNQPDMNVYNKAATHQAADADYKNNNKHLDRGHLFPCSYAPDDAAKRSTFTLTNAVPQASSFNQGSWNRMECKVKTTLELNCADANGQIKAYVVTGAVPNNNNKLMKQVNIPDLMWTAYCCYNSEKDKWIAEAHWAENVAEEKSEAKTVKQMNLSELEKELENFYKSGVRVFPNTKCPRNEDGKNTGKKRKGSEELRNKKPRGAELKECGEEDGCDCDCDEK